REVLVRKMTNSVNDSYQYGSIFVCLCVVFTIFISGSILIVVDLSGTSTRNFSRNLTISYCVIFHFVLDGKLLTH
ncbi:hypothetical protein L9F63_001143, partial [Diploptera punctata]